MKSTKRRFIASLVAMLLCLSMLIGTTFAWFTDSVTSGKNKIVAGNLDIEVSYNDGTTWKSIEGVDSLFKKDTLWEPGHTEYVTLKVENKGTLALKYKMLVTPVSENGGINMAGNPFKLSDHLMFGSTDPAATAPTYTRETARAAVTGEVGLNQAGLVKENTMLAGADPQYVTLVVYMPESVGNEANYLTGTTAPTIDLGIKVVATQVENENDSFGNNYDAGAKTTESKYITDSYYNYFEQVNATKQATAGQATVVEKGNSGNTNYAKATVPAGGAEDGADVNLSIAKTSAPDNFTVETGKAVDHYEVKVTGANADTLITVEWFIGKGMENVVVKHNNTVMTEVTTSAADVDADQKWYYDANSGILTMKTTTFSPFSVIYDEAVAVIGNVKYGSLAAAIADVKANETITMLKNVDKAAGISVPSNKSFTVDFNGFTYSTEKPGAGSAYTKTQGFQLLKDSTITFKNGTINCTADNKEAENVTDSSLPKPVKMLVQNYCNLTLDNMTLDGTNLNGTGRYTLSNNFGTVEIKNSTIIAQNGGVAFDVYHDNDTNSSYKDGVTVKLTGNTVINGNVEIDCRGVTMSDQANIKANLEVCGENVVFNNSKITAKRNFSVTSGKATFNNCELTLANENYYNTCALWVKNGAEVVWNGGKLDAGVNHGFGVDQTAKLTVSNATIIADEYAVTANGNDGGKVINLNGCTITSNKSVGVYISGETNKGQNVTIKGCKIKGATAIEVKHATMTVSDSTLIATADPATYKDNGNGDCTGGYCIASTKNTGEATGSGTITVQNCEYTLAVTDGTIAYADTGATINGIDTDKIAHPTVD